MDVAASRLSFAGGFAIASRWGSGSSLICLLLALPDVGFGLSLFFNPSISAPVNNTEYKQDTVNLATYLPRPYSCRLACLPGCWSACPSNCRLACLTTPEHLYSPSTVPDPTDGNLSRRPTACLNPYLGYDATRCRRNPRPPPLVTCRTPLSRPAKDTAQLTERRPASCSLQASVYSSSSSCQNQHFPGPFGHP